MTIGRISWHLLYHRDISSMAIHVAMAQPNSTYRDACQPNRSAGRAKISARTHSPAIPVWRGDRTTVTASRFYPPSAAAARRWGLRRRDSGSVVSTMAARHASATGTPTPSLKTPNTSGDAPPAALPSV
jgi:hypothetical protein